MAFPRNITAKLNAIEAAAKARFAGSPFIPRSDWSPELKAAHDAFDAKLALYQEFGFQNKYEYLLHLQGAVAIPERPFKPEFQMLKYSNNLEDKTYLYKLVKESRI